MRKPVWFKATCVGGVPVHWAPIAWQGWAVIGVYLIALCGGLSLRRSPALMVLAECIFAVLLIAAAALTDDRHGRKPF